MHRRQFLHLTAAAAIAAPSIVGRAHAAPRGGAPLPIPPIADLSGGNGITLEAVAGQTAFVEGAPAPTIGWSQPYLGPTLRVRRGEIARPAVANRLGFPVTAHWHGAHVPGNVDGGPQLTVAPGEIWRPELAIDQPEATLWYHSHVHGQTGPQVYHGLAGMLLVVDPEAQNPDLPDSWGLDDIPLVIQDRVFDENGRLVYPGPGPDWMMGWRGDEIVVNGAVRPSASVARGLVRLRIVNGSNARIYHLAFEDGRVFHRIASDAGYLVAPSAARTLTLAPAERAEIVVDLSDGHAVRLVSAPDANTPMGGMMGGMMGLMRGVGVRTPRATDDEGRFEILALVPDRPAPRATALPARLAGAPGPIDRTPRRRRSISLDMGPAMMRRGGMMGGGMPLGINGRRYDMGRIDVATELGAAEIWEIEATMMAHPFHVHGTSFQVLSRNGRPVPFAETGLKDVVLVEGTAEILVHFPQPADSRTPYMFHCHILEHEDGGMMAQFTVA